MATTTSEGQETAGSLSRLLPPPQSGNWTQGNIPISLQHRWLVIGTSGSGKTYFAKEWVKLLQSIYTGVNAYILDSKGQGDFDDWPGLYTGRFPPKPLAQGQGGIVTWQPPRNDLSAYDDWFGMLRTQPGPCIFLNDELANITRPDGEGTPEFELLLKQGRKPGKSVMMLTQGSVKTPRDAAGQAIHILRFRLVRKYERGIGNDLVGREYKAGEPPDPYGFYYKRTDNQRGATYFPNCQAFFGKAA